VENHHRIGGTVKTTIANPTIHITLSCRRMTTNIINTPVFNPAVNIIFSEGVKVFNPRTRRR
jgi:hypothetical protein